MQYLFNSEGEHIANFVNGYLHAPSGQHIGNYLDKEKIFVDRDGRYLGEIVQTDRLMYRISSSYRSKNFGDQGTRSNVGSYGNPGSRTNIGRITGFDDIPPSRLRP
jgi:hypothetical protein